MVAAVVVSLEVLEGHRMDNIPGQMRGCLAIFMFYRTN